LRKRIKTELDELNR